MLHIGLTTIFELCNRITFVHVHVVCPCPQRAVFFSLLLIAGLLQEQDVATQALQVSCLLLPPPNRRRLQLLLRLMARVCQNPQLPPLNDTISTRTLVPTVVYSQIKVVPILFLLVSSMTFFTSQTNLKPFANATTVSNITAGKKNKQMHLGGK